MPNRRPNQSKRLIFIAAAICVSVGLALNLNCKRNITSDPASAPAGSATSAEASSQFVRVSADIERVMGCDCRLTLYLPADQSDRLDSLVADAAEQLQKLESLMSIYHPQSEIAILNAAPADKEIPLSPPVIDIMRAGRKYFDQSGGTFDVTCLPVISVWRKAGKAARQPAPEELDAAVAISGWKKIKLTDRGAIKLDAGAGVDLGGIAKGYAADRLAESLAKAGVSAGMVDFGGSSIRCFGRRPDGLNWRIAVRNPFDSRGEPMGVLEISEGSLSVSGNYEKFVEINGKRFSHIVDPRSGRTADAVPTAVIVAPDATTGEAWSKPLSILGEQGFKLIPQAERIEAMIVVGRPEEYKTVSTPGFEAVFTPAASRPAR